MPGPDLAARGISNLALAVPGRRGGEGGTFHLCVGLSVLFSSGEVTVFRSVGGEENLLFQK